MHAVALSSEHAAAFAQPGTVDAAARNDFLGKSAPALSPRGPRDPDNVAREVLFAPTEPPGTVLAERTVLPMRETSRP